jgi:hypothetical protein
MKQWKRNSALLFAGVGITLACNATGAPESDQGIDPQQSTFDRAAEPRSAPPPPGPFRAPLPDTPRGPDQMSARMGKESPPHARWNRPEFHRGPLFGTDRKQPYSQMPEQKPRAAPQGDMTGRGWYHHPTFQRKAPPRAPGGMESPAPAPALGQQASVAPPTPGETATAAPETPVRTGAYAPGFYRPSPGSEPQPPYWWGSRRNVPGTVQSPSPWAPSPEEAGQEQQSPGYPPAAYTFPNLPPPPPPTALPRYLYPGQGYPVSGGTSSPQPGGAGYYGTAPWGGSGYGLPYPPPYPYGPGPRNW